MINSRQSFWELLSDSPAIRFQLIEISSAESKEELVKELCFDSVESLSLFIHGPLLYRVTAIGKADAAKFLLRECGRLGI